MHLVLIATYHMNLVCNFSIYNYRQSTITMILCVYNRFCSVRSPLFIIAIHPPPPVQGASAMLWVVARPRTEEANAATKTVEGSTLQQDTEDEILEAGLKGTRTTPHQDLRRETETYVVDVASRKVVSMTMTIIAEAVAVVVRVVGLNLVETALEDVLVLVSTLKLCLLPL